MPHAHVYADPRYVRLIGEKGGRGGEKKETGKNKKMCVSTRANSDTRRTMRLAKNPTHYSFTQNMMPLVCRLLQQSTACRWCHSTLRATERDRVLCNWRFGFTIIARSAEERDLGAA